MREKRPRRQNWNGFWSRVLDERVFNGQVPEFCRKISSFQSPRIMKFRIQPLVFLVSLAMSGLVCADTITLKDGTVLDGQVLKEEVDSYLVSVQVTATIKEERNIAKADIESIVKTSPADEAFEAISALVPTPDRLTAADYDRMINKQAKAFLEAFPNSRHKAKTNEIIGTLEKEREVVAQGGLKLDGKWISPADRLANAYELDARMTYDDALAAAEAGRFVQALRSLETLNADFKGSEYYEKGIEFSKRVLHAYGPGVAADLKRVPDRIVDREKELATLPANQRDAALAEIKKKEAIYAALIKREKESGTDWPTLDIYHKESMADTLRAIDAESRRLESFDPSTIKPAGPTYKNAWTAATGGDEAEAKKLFGELKTLGVPERYITALEDQLAKEEPDAPAPTTSDEPETETEPAPESTEPGEMPKEEEPEATPAPADGQPATEDSGQASQPPAEDEEGGVGMTTILFVVMGLVLVIAVVAVFAGGKKKQ
jgi:hypothetical protein